MKRTHAPRHAGPDAKHATMHGMNDQNQPAKDPKQWKSGDDPATPAQESYLHTLADQAGEDVPDDLTKAAASEKIDELRAKTGLENEGRDDDDPFRMTPVSPNANR